MLHYSDSSGEENIQHLSAGLKNTELYTLLSRKRNHFVSDALKSDIKHIDWFDDFGVRLSYTHV